MSLGFSHEVKYKAPEGVNVSNEKMIIVVSGIDKQKVGQAAAEIRALKKPEPYDVFSIMCRVWSLGADCSGNQSYGRNRIK